MKERILLAHGSGGKITHTLISDLFVKYFRNVYLDKQSDSAILPGYHESLAFTTDGFVVDPIFFPGGDIGKLAVAGTVNDLAVSGARPAYLSCSFIIEEGLPLADLEKIVVSMAREAEKAGIPIVTGDTKVVNKGKCDKVFITTSGIGFLPLKHQGISTGAEVQTGDRILINGSIADHGMAVMAARNEMELQADISSDCASLNGIIQSVLDAGINIRFMRDATRGGLANVVAELAAGRATGIRLDENEIPVKENVRGLCEILGFDPLYVANEGKVVMVTGKHEAEKALHILRKHELGNDAAIIGEVTAEHPGRAWITTGIGGKRIIDMLAGEQLPRIC